MSTLSSIPSDSVLKILSEYLGSREVVPTVCIQSIAGRENKLVLLLKLEILFLSNEKKK